jgi:hypothetical protein
MSDIIEAYFDAGATEKAAEMSIAFADYYSERLDYFLKQQPFIVNSADYEIQTAIQYTSRIANACALNGKADLAEEINAKIEAYYADYVGIQQPPAR